MPENGFCALNGFWLGFLCGIAVCVAAVIILTKHVL